MPIICFLKTTGHSGVRRPSQATAWRTPRGPTFPVSIGKREKIGPRGVPKASVAPLWGPPSVRWSIENQRRILKCCSLEATRCPSTPSCTIIRTSKQVRKVPWPIHTSPSHQLRLRGPFPVILSTRPNPLTDPIQPKNLPPIRRRQQRVLQQFIQLNVPADPVDADQRADDGTRAETQQLPDVRRNDQLLRLPQ